MRACSISLMPHRTAADRNAYMRERRLRLIAEGRCPACSSPLAEGCKLCRSCQDKSNARSAAATEAARDELFVRYGGYTCACCGETERAFLSLDHINRDGAAHRRSMSKGKSNTFPGYRTLHADLKRKGWPPVLQVLCHNCNIGRERNGGVCPHAAAKVVTV
ncbi:HNH endonuclease [Gordonia phage AnClar]|nr:HNH endonuclease [Gordonia phage AnClar]